MAFDDQMSLKNISQLNLGINEAMTFLNRQRNLRTYASDRTVAIVGGALMEHAVRIQIESKLIKLEAKDKKALFSFEEKGPLADLGSRILMGYALGCYGSVTRGDLILINRIRNGFAHAAETVHFGLPGVIALCDKLQTPEFRNVKRTAKNAFISTVQGLVVRFRIKITSTGLAIKWHAPP